MQVIFVIVCKLVTFHVEQSDDHIQRCHFRFSGVTYSLDNLPEYGKHQTNGRPHRIASIHVQTAETTPTTHRDRITTLLILDTPN
nr:MAG TPA: hypothetical protein [Caudoviricetes sp.]